MARIDLINVCKTLKDRERPALAFPFMPPTSGAQSGRGRGMVILGPIGCAKTTLLRIIAGLIQPDSGEVRYDGVDAKHVHPGDRRIGMVFQNYALYPHLTSKTNVLSYFLFKKNTSEMTAMAEAKYKRTSELMEVELAYLLDRKPTTLSGGEKQRVALGRCITRDPALFLLDEPFSNLDQALRETYRVNLKILLKRFDISTVYVTHDHHEALILADVLAIMGRGSVEQIGKYDEIYRRPKNVFVAGFLNRHIGTPPLSLIDARCMAHPQQLGNVQVGVRPEDVTASRQEGQDSIRGIVAGKVSLPMINAAILRIHVAEHEVYAKTSDEENLQTGDRVWIRFKQHHLFDKGSGMRLRSFPETPTATVWFA